MHHKDLEAGLKTFIEELKNSPYNKSAIPPEGPHLYGSQMKYGWYEEEYRKLFPEQFEGYND